MTRLKLMTTAAVLAALPTFGMAQSGTPEASTETGEAVASQKSFVYDTESPRVNNGIAEFDKSSIAMSQDTFRALANARGEMIETTSGEKVGMIEEINVNAQGNPELVVALPEDSEIPAEVLVVTLQPGNVMMQNGMLYLATTKNELELKARDNSGRDSDDRVSVTLF